MTDITVQMASPNPKAPRVAGLVSEVAVDNFAETLIALPDPDEVLDKAGLSRADLRPMVLDDEIATALETRLSAIQATPWRLEPGTGLISTFVWSILETHIETIISNCFSALPFGYSVQEAIFEKDGGRIVVARIPEKPFEWFEPRRDGTLLYNPPHGSAEVESVDSLNKFFLTVRRPTYRKPSGQPLLSSLYWAWFMRSNGWRFWARFLERFGSPLLLGRTPGDTKEMATALAAAVQSAAIAVGSDDSVEPVEVSTDGGAFDRFHTAVDKRIQKLILGQTLTSDTQGVGSQALGNVHNLVRQDRRFADIRMITPVIQRFVDALVRINFPAAKPPTFVMEDGRGLQADRAARDKTLTDAGMVKFTEQYVLDRYDFEPGDFVIPSSDPDDPDDPDDPSGPNDPGTTRQSSRQFSSAPRKFTPGQDAIEDLIGRMSTDPPQPIPPGELKKIIMSAESPEDLLRKLETAVGDGVSASEFRELVERSLFAADLMGYSHAANEGGA